MTTNEAASPERLFTGNSEKDFSSRDLGSSSQSTRLDLDDVLETLGWVHEECIAVCHRPIGGQFSTSVVESVNASTLVSSLPGDADIWFGVNPTSGPVRSGAGRGGEREITRWVGLYLDVDVKDGAFPDRDKAEEFVRVLSTLIGIRPSVVIYSGHGLQPLWAIADGKLDAEVKWNRAHRLSRRFGRLAAEVAGDFAAKLDNVSDLTRVLRVPRTTNWKDPDNPAEVYAVRDIGARLTVDEVEEFLDARAPESEPEQPVGEFVVSPVEDWEFACTTCAYVSTMAARWGQELDRPQRGRHQWLVDRCVRLASAYRVGCITESDINAYLMRIEAALFHWCEVIEPKREPLPDEVLAGFRWGIAKVQNYTEQQAWEDLGRHGPCCGPANGTDERDVGLGDRAQPHLLNQLLRIPDLRDLPPAEPLIEGLLYKNTIAQLTGAPGCYKTFGTIGMSCAFAAGVPFGDFAVPNAGNVVYVAAEGVAGLRMRILAFCEVWGIDPALLLDRLRILPVAIQLGNQVDVSQAIDVVRAVDADLLVLDTRARCTLGLEENSATAQGQAIDAADRIRAAAGCTVLGVHHSSRTGTAGRGSNAWDGAVWSDLRMDGRNLQATIHCEKHKDVAAGCDHHFRLVRHTVSSQLMPGFEPYRSTLVLSSHGPGLEGLTPNSQRVVLEIIRNSAPAEGFTAPQVVELADAVGVGKSSTYVALKALVSEDLVRNIGSSNRSRYVPGERQP